MNNAATTYPKPASVADAVAKSVCALPSEQGRSTADDSRIIEKCRRQMAALIHAAAPEEIYFTSGATESANLVISGLDLDGGHVVTTVTEHNCILRPLYRRENKTEITCVACDGYGFVRPENIEKAVRKNTKAIFVNHCSNVTGAVQNIEEIGRIAQKHGLLFVVDGAQSLGSILTDVQRAKIDVLIFTAHKSLFGVSGTGGLYIRRGTPVKPVKVGGTGFDSYLVRLPKDYSVFECGTPNVSGISGLSAGFSFLENEGFDNVFCKLGQMTKALAKELSEMPNLELYYKEEASCGAVLSFNIRGLDAADVGYILTNVYGIVLRTGLHCCPLIHEHIHSGKYGTVRISLSYFTTEDDICALKKAVRELCENASAV